MPGEKLEENYRKARKILQQIWESKKLPYDTRRYICGAVYQAGKRQGDEVYNSEFIRIAATGEPLNPDDQLEMFEAVHEFVFIQNRLRPQYVLIVLAQTVTQLNNEHSDMAHEFEKQLAAQAALN